MKEYRIIATITITNISTGKTNTYDSFPFNEFGGKQSTIYTSLKEAKAALPKVVEKAEKLDRKSQQDYHNHKPYTIMYEQYNFRIQSRTVTEWK